MLDERLKISRNASILDAISKLVEGKKKAIFIVDDNGALEGLFTNGDMRRFFLLNQDLSGSISEIMNPSPIVFHSRSEAEKVRENRKLVVYPIVNKENILVDAIYEKQTLANEIINEELANVPLVLMAGGEGTRLRPYTKIIPKALIPIGDYTITERIIHSFYQYGCKDIYFVLNYRANMIRAYFNDLVKNYHVNFVEETRFCGTAGGLQLLKNKIETTFFLSNCDILINDDLSCAYKTHKNNGNTITFICSMKSFEIPYGIVNTDLDGQILSMQEKPKFNYLVNSGVYIIEPDVLDYIRPDEFVHMPDLAKRCMDDGRRVGVFPISERAWLDMGQFDSMETMLKELEVD